MLVTEWNWDTALEVRERDGEKKVWISYEKGGEIKRLWRQALLRF
jgi:hypothetical protein